MTTAEHIFDATAYDLEGTPTLNGRKAKTITLAFDNHQLRHRIASDMELAGQLQPGNELTLTITAKVIRRTWDERPGETDQDIATTIRLSITEDGLTTT